jgi:hypothetical protein
VLAFAFGSLLLAPFLLNFDLLPKPRAREYPDLNLPKSYLLAGVAFCALLSVGVEALPSATAIVATGQQLVMVGLGLCSWCAWRVRDYRKLAFWLTLTLLIPLVTVVTIGFIGYGAVAALVVLTFVSGFVKSRPTVLIAGLLLAYLGLSVYVTYMRDRGQIRETVWGGQSLVDRVNRVEETFADFEWFAISNAKHLQAVDGRLNQSALVGFAVSRLSEIGGYAHGQTISDSMLALVPRALWPDKPFQAGSGNMVSEYTGLTFAGGTSVGIGQVMEFYVNFATLGVVVGFILMGVLVTVLDTAAAERLAANDLHGFVLWYMPGISLLQVGGSLMEVTTSAAASVVVALLVNKYLERVEQRKLPTRVPSLPPMAAHSRR